MLRVRRVAIVWLAVGLSVVLGVCHSARIKRGGLHPGAHGREGVSYREDRLWGQTLLHRHGHHDGRGGGRGTLGVHLLHVRSRPGAVFGGEHDVLLMLLLEVAGG